MAGARSRRRAGPVTRAEGPQVPGLVKRNERPLLHLNELITPKVREDATAEELLTRLLEDGSSQTQRTWDEASVTEETLVNAMELAMQRGDWATVNAVVQQPQQVWKLACTGKGSRKLQDVLGSLSGDKPLSKEEQAVRKVAIDHVIAGLQSHVLEAASHSNFVFQACIQALPVERFEFILEEMKNSIVVVAMDQHGCKVLQRLLEHVLQHETHAQQLMKELFAEMKKVAKDCYGNYVLQKFAEMACPEQKVALARALLDAARPGDLADLAMDRYASWVIEKIVKECPSGSVLDDLMFTMKSELDSKRFNGKAKKKKKYGSFVSRTFQERWQLLQQEREHTRWQYSQSFVALLTAPESQRRPWPWHP